MMERKYAFQTHKINSVTSFTHLHQLQSTMPVGATENLSYHLPMVFSSLVCHELTLSTTRTTLTLVTEE